MTCESEETGLDRVFAANGETTVMYASDYCHWDCHFPYSVKDVVDSKDLSFAQKEKLARQKCRRIFRAQKSAGSQSSEIRAAQLGQRQGKSSQRLGSEKMILGIDRVLVDGVLLRARAGSREPVQNPNRFPLSSVFLHAFLRRAGKRHLQKIWHRVRIHSDGHRHPAPSRGRWQHQLLYLSLGGNFRGGGRTAAGHRHQLLRHLALGAGYAQGHQQAAET